MEILSALLDVALGAAAFKLAWSVDRTQRAMLLIQEKQTKILEELTLRVERLEAKIN